MTYGEDRRSSKRISHVCEVECEGAGLRRLTTRINDLSSSGAFIDSISCFSPGTILKLRFHVLGILIDTEAEVRYSMPQLGMGVRFLALTPNHLAALESLIDDKPLVFPSAEPHKADMLLGNFAVVSMFDVIQIVENNRLCGALEVTSPEANGEIHFNDGQIVGALSDPTTGTEALRSFLGVREGSFEFKRSSTPYPLTIEAQSNMSLLLDLLRVTDEEAALQ